MSAVTKVPITSIKTTEKCIWNSFAQAADGRSWPHVHRLASRSHIQHQFPYHRNRNSLIPHCRVRKKFKSDEPWKAFSAGPKQHAYFNLGSGVICGATPLTFLSGVFSLLSSLVFPFLLLIFLNIVFFNTAHNHYLQDKWARSLHGCVCFGPGFFSTVLCLAVHWILWCPLSAWTVFLPQY